MNAPANRCKVAASQASYLPTLSGAFNSSIATLTSKRFRTKSMTKSRCVPLTTELTDEFRHQLGFGARPDL